MAVVDLFAGAGGISEGFSRAGYEVLGGLDIDPDAVATFAVNFPKAAAIWVTSAIHGFASKW